MRPDSIPWLPFRARSLREWRQRWAALGAEQRYLAQGLGLCGLVLACAGLGLGLWQRAEGPVAAYQRGDVDGAVQGWVQEAWSDGPLEARKESLWRAALLAGAELEHARYSAELLRQYAEAWPDDRRAAEAWSRRAALLEQRLDMPRESVVALELAGEAAERVGAGSTLAPGPLWLQAGRARAELGQRSEAERNLHRAALFSEVASVAWIAIGQLNLGDDPATAFESFDAALQAARSAEERSVALLGKTTAVERLEGRGAALAQLDEAIEASPGDEALLRRRARLVSEP